MTIRELKERVPEVKLVKLPSAKALREADIPVVADTNDCADTSLGDGCRAVVYMNGLVLYTNGKHTTVFRLHKCRETYGEGSKGDFAQIPYQFMLMLEGEQRLEHNQDMKEASWNTSSEYLEDDLGYEVPGDGDILEDLILDDMLKFLFSKLTERQKKIVHMYYLEEKKQADIAVLLGIQRVTVATTLRTAIRILREKYPLY